MKWLVASHNLFDERINVTDTLKRLDTQNKRLKQQTYLSIVVKSL